MMPWPAFSAAALLVAFHLTGASETWRVAEQLELQEALEGIPTYPHRINPLSVLPDGRLYGNEQLRRIRNLVPVR